MESIDDLVAEKPIELPEHPYLAALRDFGGDEVVAGVIDAVATTTASYVVSPALKPYVLPLVGPALEKVGFFPLHFRKAYQLYKTMPPSKREPLMHYFKQAIKNGGANLAKDVLIHDPMYIGFMAAGLQLLPQVPPGLLSATSYITAVALVAGLDVIKDEYRHNRMTNKFKQAGFRDEKYYEARFCLKDNPQTALEMLTKEFNLDAPHATTYTDTYFNNTIKRFAGRDVKVRLRQREATEYERAKKGIERSDSLQLVFTHAREQKADLDQYRYFITKKHKLWYPTREQPRLIRDMADSEAKRMVLPYTNGETRSVTFTRTIANGKELAACTDAVKQNGAYLLELKTWHDKDLLRQAMRFVMMECPVAAMQTTKGKYDLFG